MTELLEQTLREIYAEDAASYDPSGAVQRLRNIDYSLATSRRRRLWATIAASGTALTAGIVTAVLLLSSGAPTAYAEWAAVPTTPTPSALETAVHKCYKVGRNDPNLTLPAPGGSAQPVLAEGRGRSAAAVYVVDSQVYMCLYERGSEFTSLVSASMGPLRVTPGADQISIPYGISGGSGSSSPTHPLTRAQRLKLQSELKTSGAPRIRRGPLDGGSYFALGQAGSDISAVTFAFANGKTVTASVQNGWYFAWWPWYSDPTSVTITTSSGTTSSPMKNTWPDRWGSRPYPACQPASSGCVFAARQPAASTTTTTTVGTTTTPTSISAQVATAIQTCDAFSMSSQSVPANAFAGPLTLTQTHGIFTALFSMHGREVSGCLTGGNQKDIHAFFIEDLASFGPVRVAPGPDQLSVPYVSIGGGGGGRPIGRPFGKNATQAQLQAWHERLTGGGYGPYTLGQAGSDVSAVTITFANGKSVTATVQNGWYFAWWPWISDPTSVTVATKSGTATSPLASSSGARTPLVPGCQPDSTDCVFVNEPTAPAQTTTTPTTATIPTSTATTTGTTTAP